VNGEIISTSEEEDREEHHPINCPMQAGLHKDMDGVDLSMRFRGCQKERYLLSSPHRLLHDASLEISMTRSECNEDRGDRRES
jgi:hypothetical protein